MKDSHPELNVLRTFGMPKDSKRAKHVAGSPKNSEVENGACEARSQTSINVLRTLVMSAWQVVDSPPSGRVGRLFCPLPILLIIFHFTWLVSADEVVILRFVYDDRPNSELAAALFVNGANKDLRRRTIN